MQTPTGPAASRLETKQSPFARGCIRASLQLDFERDEHTGRTVLGASQQEPPLRVVRAFPLADGAAMVHLHNVSGGVLGGDRLGLTVRVGAGARAQVTTTGATRIYRAREEAPAALLSNDVTVGENALLEYVPDALIPFAGARLTQRATIRLELGAGLFWWEILAPGREAYGEVFEYASVELKTDFMAMGKPIAVERVRLEPKSHAVWSLARLATYRTWATFYICRVGVDPHTWFEAENELRKVVSAL